MWEQLLCLLPPLSSFLFVHKWTFALFLGSRPHWDLILLSIWCFHPLVYHIKREYCELKCDVRKVCSHFFFTRWLKFIWLKIMKQCCSWSFRSLPSLGILWKANNFMPLAMCILPSHIWCNICHIALNKYVSLALTSVQTFLSMWEVVFFLYWWLTGWWITCCILLDWILAFFSHLLSFPCISIFDQ